ncbi:hypothetical protein Tco_1437813, partial [Tanacetum coccineum]
RIAWNDDNDEIDVIGLDSRFEAKLVKLAKVNVKSKLTHLRCKQRKETPAALMATSEPPAARLG